MPALVSSIPPLSVVAILGAALLYAAAPASATDLDALRAGEMRKLVVNEAPVEVPAIEFTGPDGQPTTLAASNGRVRLVNFWATWCAPCRKEIGSLDRLQAALGGDRFAVVTIATGPNPLPGIEKLFAEEKITHLPKLRDPGQTLARPAGVLALPVTLLVDAEGREIGRLMGDAEWDSPEAQALVKAAAGL